MAPSRSHQPSSSNMRHITPEALTSAKLPSGVKADGVSLYTCNAQELCASCGHAMWPQRQLQADPASHFQSCTPHTAVSAAVTLKDSPTHHADASGPAWHSHSSCTQRSSHRSSSPQECIPRTTHHVGGRKRCSLSPPCWPGCGRLGHTPGGHNERLELRAWASDHMCLHKGKQLACS